MKINDYIVDDHVTILHDKSFRRLGDTNCRMSINSAPLGATATQVLTANTVYAWPFIVDNPIRITDISTIVTTGVGGTSIRLCIYRDNGNFYPSIIVPRTDTGDISSAANGTKTVSFASMVLRRGIYWAAIQSNGAPTIRANSQNVALRALGIDTDLTLFTNWQFAHTFGAFPGRFPAASKGKTNIINVYFSVIK